jgi:23S rRNA pseudouridine955/2504/2580 synthase
LKIDLKIEILYEDNEILLVNKPAGFPVHATVDPLRAHVQGILEKERNEKLVLHHRLDLETTGVLVFARDERVNKALTDLFRDREVEKTYWAVVDGRWLESWTEVQTYIKKLPGGKWANVPKGRGGDYAETAFRLLSSNGAKSWIEAKPKTGRTHQIRLHCLEKEHPILGDRQYFRAEKKGFPMALHARSIRFKHPLTRQEIFVEASAPDYWDTYYLKGL